jgi:feruloyl esterase
MIRSKTWQLMTATASAAAALAAAGAARADQAGCAKLQAQPIAASAIGLPTTGAVILSAEMVTTEKGEPEFCKVLGEIKPVDPAAPVIQFEVNLPSTWNGKMIQRGGGGLDGTVVTGLGPFSDDGPDTPTALTRGYATFGGDSGHHYPPGVNPLAPGYSGPNPASFGMNRESLVNFAYGSIKKTHDVAKTLVGLYYGKAPAKTFFVGSSEGGREALVAVQKFPNDYDGVVSEVPLLSFTGTNLDQYALWRATVNGGWLSPAKVALLRDASAAACDKLDGLQDGVVARYLTCDASAQTKALRCPGGTDTGETCLSDPQLAFVEKIRSPLRYGYPIAHGEMDYPAWPTGGEAYIPFLEAPFKPPADDKGRNSIAVNIARVFIFQDDSYVGELDMAAFKARILEISGLFDMTDPDLSSFKGRGGKLILLEHGGDYTVNPGAAYHYYRSVLAKMGKASADQFVRMYVAPGLVHFGVGARADGSPLPNKFDVLGVLEGWTEHGVAPPEDLVLTSYDKGGGLVSSWPMCRYGAYPHFQGSGDSKQAASFACKSMSVDR